MVSEIKRNEIVRGIFITIDYSKNEVVVKDNNNGNEPESFIFEMGDFVDIRTIGTELISHFRIEPNGGCGDNSGNRSGETGLEVESEDVQTEIEPEISSGSDLINNQETGASVGIKPNIVQVVPSFREVTAGEIAEEIRNTVDLNKGEAKILAALFRSRGATKGEIHKMTGILYPDISVYLTRLIEELRLVYYGDKKIIKPNYEKIKSFFPWFFIVEIQKAISELSSKNTNEPKLVFGKATPKIIHLLYKYPKGLTKKAIIDGTGLSFPLVSKAIESMVKKDLIKIEKKGIQVVIFPNFSVNQIVENPIISEEPAVIETDQVRETVEDEEPTINLSTDDEDSTTPQEPTVIETVPVPKTVGDKELKSKFNNERLLSLINRITKGSSVQLHKISSEHGVKKDKGLAELLDIINEKVAIELVETGTDKGIISWKQKYLEKIDLENFRVRKFSGERIDEGGLEESKEHSNQEAVVDNIKPDELPGNKAIFEKKVIKEIKPEDIEGIREGIIRRAESKKLGGPFQNILNILVDNYPSSMGIKELIEEAIKRSMTGSSVKPYLNILLDQGLIKKDIGKYKLSTERK